LVGSIPGAIIRRMLPLAAAERGSAMKYTIILYSHRRAGGTARLKIGVARTIKAAVWILSTVELCMIQRTRRDPGLNGDRADA
jgi:hypothetical protein